MACVHLTETSRIGELYANYFSVYFPTPLFEWSGLGQPPLAWVQVAGWVLLASLILAALGLLTRLALTLSWIAFFLFYGTILGFEKPDPNAISTYTFHYNNIVLSVLAILSVAPGIDRWGLGELRRLGWKPWALVDPARARVAIPVWPTRLIKINLALAYVGSGYCKLTTAGLAWADGHNLQAILLGKFLQEGAWAGHWLSQFYWACVVLSVATLALELAFVAMPFLESRRSLTWLFVAAGLAFHISIQITMKIAHFLPFMGLTYLLFLDWTVLSRIIGAFVGTGRRDVPDAVEGGDYPGLAIPARGRRNLVRGFNMGFAAVLVLCIVGKVEVWPLSDYGVFRGRSRPAEIRVGRIRGSGADGVHWLAPEDLGSGFHGWFDSHFGRFRTSFQARTRPGVSTATFEETAPAALRDYHRHLPPQTRDRFPVLEYVVRSVQPGQAGEWVITDGVVLSSVLTAESPR